MNSSERSSQLTVMMICWSLAELGSAHQVDLAPQSLPRLTNRFSQINNKDFLTLCCVLSSVTNRQTDKISLVSLLSSH